jgi:class 3 adenylate cyclase
MAADEIGAITRGFLFADIRGYTDFVERSGAAAELLTQYRTLAREAIGRFGGAEIETEGDSIYVARTARSVRSTSSSGPPSPGNERTARDAH